MWIAKHNSEMIMAQARACANTGSYSHSNKQGTNYTLLCLVVMMHVFVALALLKAVPKKTELDDRINSMTVSLISRTISKQENPQAKKKQELTEKKSPRLAMQENKHEQKKPELIKDEKTNPENTESTMKQSNPKVTQANNQTETNQEDGIKQQEDSLDTRGKIETTEVNEPPSFSAAYLNNPAPAYPQIARRLGQQGRVLLKVMVEVNGNPETVEIIKSSGYEKLDEAAIEAVKNWKFKPAKRSGQEVSDYVLVPVRFSMSNLHSKID